ncbi:MAG: response regulator [Bacteroidota bacterium]
MRKSVIKVLYVDDEEENLITFKSLFRRKCAVKTALSGSEALTVLAKENFDIVFTDQRMPEMTGVELCRFIQQKYPTIRRHIITAYGELSALNAAITKGTISSIIAKPFDMEKVEALIFLQNQ